MRGPWPVLVAMLCASPIPCAQAEVICVNPGGTGGCLASIVSAVNAADFADIIDVAAGTYPEDITSLDRRLRIRGAGPGATIIQGRVFILFNDSFELSGVTLDSAGVAPYAIHLDYGTSATVTNCEITGYPGNAISVAGTLSLEDSTVHDNAASGIVVNVEDSRPRLTVNRSTISGNGQHGILISASPDRGSVVVRVDDTTISGNGDAGIASEGLAQAGRRLRVRRSTITGNGGGIVDLVPDPFRVLLEATIVANSTAGADVAGPAMRLRSRGYNLIETLDPGTTLSGSGPDLLGVDPVLGPLQNNGGATETHALLAGSPALEAIPSNVRCGQPDQRGVPREPAPCDIGAYEAP